MPKKSAINFEPIQEEAPEEAGQYVKLAIKAGETRVGRATITSMGRFCVVAYSAETRTGNSRLVEICSLLTQRALNDPEYPDEVALAFGVRPGDQLPTAAQVAALGKLGFNGPDASYLKFDPTALPKQS